MEEALDVDNVVGLVTGTRPVYARFVVSLEELNRQTFLLVEYGIESTDDHTLARINRGHTFACTEDAVPGSGREKDPGQCDIGFPGEDSEKLIRQAEKATSVSCH